MSSNNFISLVIPNHNKGKFLYESLTSIKNQTFQEWEAIIVDDGSTDHSREIIEAFLEQDKRFKAIFLPKQKHGGAICRNHGLSQARGEWIMFFDSDDILLPYCLEARIKALKSSPNLDFGVFALESFVHEPTERGLLWLPQKAKALNRFLSHDLPWQTMQPIYRRQFLVEMNLFWREDVSRLQDVFFHVDCLLKNPEFEVFAGSPDCKYRVDAARKTSKPFQHYQNWTNAVIKFVTEFSNQIPEKRNLVKLTAVEALQAFKFAQRSGELTASEFNILGSSLIERLGGFRLRFYYYYLKFIPFHVPGIKRIIRLSAQIYG